MLFCSIGWDLLGFSYMVARESLKTMFGSSSVDRHDHMDHSGLQMGILYTLLIPQNKLISMPDIVGGDYGR